MRKYHSALFALAGFVALLLTAASVFRPGPSQAQARQTLAARLRQTVPLQTPAPEAIRRLTAAALDPSPYNPATRQIRLLQRSTSHNFPVTGSIEATLRFDRNDRLSSITLRDLYTGP